MFVLHDTELKGFITWQEKGAIAVMMFTTGLKADEYWHKVFPNRPLSVYRLDKRKATDFVQDMLNAGITHAIIDVPWQHADESEPYSDEEVRNYVIADLATLRARMS